MAASVWLGSAWSRLAAAAGRALRPEPPAALKAAAAAAALAGRPSSSSPDACFAWAFTQRLSLSTTPGGADSEGDSGGSKEVKRQLKEVRANVVLALQREVPKELLPQLKYLLSVGVKVDDLSKVAIRELNGVRSDSFKKVLHRPELIKTKVGYFQDRFDVNGRDIGKMIVRSVNTLFILQTDKLQERIDVLRRLGLDDRDVSRLLSKSATLFSMTVQTLEGKIETLRAMIESFEGGLAGDPTAFLLKLVRTRPQVLTRSGAKLDEALGVLRSNGFSDEDVAQALFKNPNILGYDPKSLQQKLTFLEEYGLAREQIKDFFAAAPKLFDLAVETNMRPTFDFFLETGWEVAILCEFPQVLNYSLEKRIKPRHQFLQIYAASYDPVGRYRWVTCSDEDFAKVANSTLEAWVTFRTACNAM